MPPLMVVPPLNALATDKIKVPSPFLLSAVANVELSGMDPPITVVAPTKSWSRYSVLFPSTVVVMLDENVKVPLTDLFTIRPPLDAPERLITLSVVSLPDVGDQMRKLNAVDPVVPKLIIPFVPSGLVAPVLPIFVT